MWAMVCTTTITAMLSVYVPSSHTTNTVIRGSRPPRHLAHDS